MTKTQFMACDRGDYGDYDGECVVVLDEEMTRRVAVVFEDEDAAFIVKAVNAHDNLVEALRAILAVETHDLHVGYDNGAGGGNFVYADVIRTDDEAFVKARAALEGLE